MFRGLSSEDDHSSGIIKLSSYDIDFRKLRSEGMRREPLWKVNDQEATLAELVSHAGDLKEAPLRRDVRSLGRLLGEVLKEQVGNELFVAVEELRSWLMERRRRHERRETSEKTPAD